MTQNGDNTAEDGMCLTEIEEFGYFYWVSETGRTRKWRELKS